MDVHYHRRNLPHYYPEGAKFFITFRLYDSIPQAILNELKADLEANIAEIIRQSPPEAQAQLIDKQRKKHFLALDDYLDKVKNGPHYLQQAEVAQIVQEALHFRDGKLYDLLAYCVMSNHVHLVIDTGVQLEKSQPYHNLDKIMDSLKGFTAYQANRQLGRKGHFWQAESYDRVIRTQEELENIIRYVLNNPVKAGIVDDWEAFPYSYHCVSAGQHSVIQPV
ncbi:MAG: transposase [Microscillaceae bacterium]|jgi:REP element-mobilizing transposase RayT|nr:transposase [Microscillaceae bacterium]